MTSIFGLLTALDARDLPMLFNRLAETYRGTVENNKDGWHQQNDRQAEVWLFAADCCEHAAKEIKLQLAMFDINREKVGTIESRSWGKMPRANRREPLKTSYDEPKRQRTRMAREEEPKRKRTRMVQL